MVGCMDGHYGLCRVFGLGMILGFLSCRLIAVSYSMSAFDFRFLVPFVLSALLVAAVALIEEQIEVEFFIIRCMIG